MRECERLLSRIASERTCSPERAREELEPLLARIRKRKQGLGQLVFVPGVLRAVVSYNVAIANRIENELQQTKQKSDHEMSGLSAFVGDDDDAELPLDEQELDPATGSLETPEELGPVFESAAISAIARAMRERAEGGRRGTTVHQRIASRVDLANLNDAELSHLAAVDAEGPERTLGRTVVVGLLLRTALESALDLREVGISPERLRNEWAVELDSAVQQLVDDRVTSNAYQEACALTELKTRFLYESVSSVATRMRRSQSTPPPSTPGAQSLDDRGQSEAGGRAFARGSTRSVRDRIVRLALGLLGRGARSARLG